MKELTNLQINGDKILRFGRKEIRYNSSMNVKNFENTMFLIKYFYKDHMVTLAEHRLR